MNNQLEFDKALPQSLPLPKRVRADTAEEENHYLRSELEKLKELVNHLTAEITNLKSSMGISMGSSRPMTYKDAVGPQDPQLVHSSPKPLRKDAKSIKIHQNRQFSEPLTTSTVLAPPSGQPTNSALQNSSQPSVIVEEWSEVKKKSQTKAPIKKTTQPSQTLRSRLDRVSSKEEALKMLLKGTKPPEELTSEIVILRAKLPLTKAAQSQPMLAWRQVLKNLTGHLPLSISLINPCQAELFYDAKQASKVSDALKELDYLKEALSQFNEQDLERRKLAYLNGYFLPLRRAALTGFNVDSQKKILSLASECLTKKFKDKLTQQQWKHQISKDLAWIEQAEKMEV